MQDRCLAKPVAAALFKSLHYSDYTSYILFQFGIKNLKIKIILIAFFEII